MKVLIGYPPTISKKGTALLSQNRQFQWFTNPTFLFPVVMASAATMLKENGYDVLYVDSIVENLDRGEFSDLVYLEKPDLLFLETKTPVINQHWRYIDYLKGKFPKVKIAICGDHVTALPEESLRNSKVDFVVTGGDYDFLLNDLCDYLSKKTKKMPKGVYYRKGRKIVGSKFELKHNLDEAPFIDRELTKWWLYQKEYNMVYRPYMYIMSGRDCWHGQCLFCAWPVLYPKFRVRSVTNVLDEIGMLINRYGVKEIFDDSGTLMVGQWLRDLCYGLIKKGYNKKIRYSCNMRFGALTQEDFNLMKKAGFRLLKFGLESGNQETLDKLNKKITVKDIIDGCKMAKKAGLTVHLTMIVGYPWEGKKKASKTLRLAKYLMENGYSDILQSTVLVPYPGTPLYKEAVEKNWFSIDSKEYVRFDMSEAILKSQDMTPEEIAKMCNKIYHIFLTPKYILNHIQKIKNKDDLAYTLRGVKAVLGHLTDFGKK